MTWHDEIGCTKTTRPGYAGTTTNLQIFLKIEPGSEKPKSLFYLILFALQVEGEYPGENEAPIFFLYFFVVYAGENSFLLVYWSSQYLPSRKLCAEKIA